MAATKYLFDIGERNFLAIFHDNNFIWYIKSKTHYVSSFKELTGYVQKLDNDSLLTQEREHYKKQIVAVGRSLMKDMTGIIAFMSCQLESYPFSVAALDEGNSLKHYLIHATNNFGAELQNSIDTGAPCMPSIIKFNAEFDKIIESFSRIEQEKNQ